MENAFSTLIRAAVTGDTGAIARVLTTNPELVARQLVVGATRQHAKAFFFEEAKHYLYAGDTALHMAAAGFQRAAAELLVTSGASCRVRNRRGAEPLHYAADANRWKPDEQRTTIEYLLAAGADPNALDKSGVSPLHRAVRTRSSPAVAALLAGGADVRARNRNGSSPLHLAVQDTGRGGTGSQRSRREQETIIRMLIESGARAEDKDSKGRTVAEACSRESIRSLLR